MYCIGATRVRVTFKLLQKAMKVHVPRRYQVQKEDMAKRVTALQRQLAASQSSAMQAQFAHEEFKVSWNTKKLHVEVNIAEARRPNFSL